MRLLSISLLAGGPAKESYQDSCTVLGIVQIKSWHISFSSNFGLKWLWFRMRWFTQGYSHYQILSMHSSGNLPVSLKNRRINKDFLESSLRSKEASQNLALKHANFDQFLFVWLFFFVFLLFFNIILNSKRIIGRVPCTSMRVASIASIS